MRIGILGAGQLGMMLGEAAASEQIQELAELECIFYDQAPDPCAAAAGKVYSDLQEFIQESDIFTYEFENIPQQIIQQLPQDKILYPPAQALHIAADRYKEKSYFAKLGIGTAGWLPLNCEEDLFAAAQQLGLPLLVKSARMGYDGKGQLLIEDEQQLQEATKDLAEQFTGQHSGESPFIAEQLVDFQRELSLLAARDAAGNIVHYPVIENVHNSGILYSSSAPASIDPITQHQCQQWMEELLSSLSYVGLLTLELFDCEEQGLLANEMAPRVHNSGHWTIEGAETSQFANHIRAITGIGLGSTSAIGYSKMYNLVGSAQSIPAEAKSNGNIHIYGKTERAGRKLGHITFNASTEEELAASCSCMHNHRNFVL